MKTSLRRMLVALLSVMLVFGMSTSAFAYTYTSLDDDGNRGNQTTADSDKGATNNIVYASIGMFRLLDEGTYVVVNDDNTVTAHVKTAYAKSNNYDRIALSEYPSEAEDPTAILDSLAITADNLGSDGNITDTSVNDEGATTYSAEFTFKIPVSDVGRRIPIVMSVGGTWKNKNYYVTVLTESYNFARAEGSLSAASYTYTGAAIEPEVVLTLDGKTLVKDTDYKVGYENNVNSGKAIVTIEGVQHNYAGTKIAEFTINPASINSATVAAITAKTYNGKAQTPAVTVSFGGKNLVKDKDYTVVYANNTNAGTAKVTVTGKGNFTGTKAATFKINPANQKLTMSTAKKTVKFKKLKKKAQQTSKVAVSGAKTKVTYAKVSGSKKLSINKTTGKIKVAKKTKKGTYKITVKATAAKSTNYKAATVTKTIKVKVK
ncbi:MAG: hypothetical protein E7226_02910 [Clostridiales bacterium]|nr:hypothetical protein [Clostridiales bacterium]